VVLAYAVIILIIVAIILRRDLNAIGRIPFRGGWKLAAIVIGLFVLQAVTVLYVPGQTVLQLALVILSHLALILLCVLNYRIPGAKLFALGVALNTIVMVANGGWMPVTPETHYYVHPDRVIAVESRPSSSKNIIIPREETNLWILSDIVRVTLPWRRNAVSIGDLVMILGIGLFIFRSTSRREKTLPDQSISKEPQAALKESGP